MYDYELDDYESLEPMANGFDKNYGGLHETPPNLPICKFGVQCYQVVEEHFTRFSHPHLDEQLKKEEEINKSFADEKKECSELEPRKSTSPRHTSTSSSNTSFKPLLLTGTSSGANTTCDPLEKAPESCGANRIRTPYLNSPNYPENNRIYPFKCDISFDTRMPLSRRQMMSTVPHQNQSDGSVGTKRPVGVMSTAPQSNVNLSLQRFLPPRSRWPYPHRLNTPRYGSRGREHVPNQTAFKSVAEKLDASAPYNMFLTRVASSKDTYIDSKTISFGDLLDPSLGELNASMHINFMVEIDWLQNIYQRFDLSNKPLTLVYGILGQDEKLPDNVTAMQVKPNQPYGHHHSKISFFFYDDNSLRIVVGTANLIESDWASRTQGVWVSPACPQLQQGSSCGESPTGFKLDLLLYLTTYNTNDYIAKASNGVAFNIWIQRVQKADFSKINVFFVGSVPKTRRMTGLREWGHLRLAKLLAQHAHVPDNEEWPIVAQCSSIGSLGPTAKTWLGQEFQASLSVTCNAVNASQAFGPVPIKVPAVKMAPIKLIYPTYVNVGLSYTGISGGACLPYTKQVHDKQPWLSKYMHAWRSESTGRTRALPHIKTYTRLSPCNKKIAWFLLTSANLSKAAWGYVLKDKSSLNLMSFEAGVLFLPKFVLPNEAEEFSLTGDNAFPMPYDTPLTPYEEDDAPWFIEALTGQQR